MTDLGHLELGKGIDDRNSGMNRPFGFAFVRQRVAEEGDDVIAQSLKDVTLLARVFV